MDTQFATVDPPDSAPPGNRERHVALVGVAGSNTDLLADALDPECSVERVESSEDVDCVLSAASLVSVAIVDATSVTAGVRRLASRLREHDVPILLLTKRVSPSLRRSVDAHGAFGVLEKPIRRTELRDAVRRLSRD